MIEVPRCFDDNCFEGGIVVYLSEPSVTNCIETDVKWTSAGRTGFAVRMCFNAEVSHDKRSICNDPSISRFFSLRCCQFWFLIFDLNWKWKESEKRVRREWEEEKKKRFFFLFFFAGKGVKGQHQNTNLIGRKWNEMKWNKNMAEEGRKWNKKTKKENKIDRKRCTLTKNLNLWTPHCSLWDVSLNREYCFFLAFFLFFFGFFVGTDGWIEW